jgi:cell division protein FtsA
MAGEELVVGIDIGASKICAVVAAVTTDDQLNILGAGTAPSGGMRRGAVEDVNAVAQAVRAALERAEQQSGYRIMSAYVGISGAHISSTNGRGVVTVRRPDGVITDDDVERVLDAARAVNLPPERELIQHVSRAYTVDNQDAISNPTGMVGRRLEVETTLISGNSEAIARLQQAVEQAGVQVDSLVVQPVAAAEATLTTAERDMGVVLIDIGGGTTDAAVFKDGTVAWVTSIAVGGQHITNDIVRVLQVQPDVAEQLKLNYGHANAVDIPDDEDILLDEFDPNDDGVVSARELAEIIEARLAETLELIEEQLTRAGFMDGVGADRGSLTGGIVLVGGTAQLPGIRKLSAGIFGTSVRVGAPTGLIGLIESVNDSSHAATIGLLRWGIAEFGEYNNGHGNGFFGRFRAWLRKYFP